MDKRVQVGVGGLLVAHGLLILRYGCEDQLVLAAVVQKGVVAEQGVLEGGGFLHPAQALHQHKTVSALLETAGGLGLAVFFLHLLQQGLGRVVDGQALLQGIQVHRDGLQIEAGPESPVVFPQGLQLPESAPIMRPGLGRLAVPQIKLAEAELRDSGADGAALGIGGHLLQGSHSFIEAAHHLQLVQVGGIGIEELAFVSLFLMGLHQVPAGFQHAFLVSGVEQFGNARPPQRICHVGRRRGSQ